MKILDISATASQNLKLFRGLFLQGKRMLFNLPLNVMPIVENFLTPKATCNSIFCGGLSRTSCTLASSIYIYHITKPRQY